jgi:PKD repeat protein
VEEILLNVPPIAQFVTDYNIGRSPLTVTFNAVGSTDPDGMINSYEWDFGDGQSDSGVNVSHTFTAETTTTYTVTLTVIDDDGATSTCAQGITVVIPLPENRPPTAQFTAEPDTGELPLTVIFDANQSSDTDGTIASYTWNFGDGTPEVSGGLTKISTQHTYTAAGTYTVTLTVTDDDGEIGTYTDIIECSPYIGIHSIWTIPIMWQEKLEKETAIDGLRLIHEFLLVGKDGTIFVSAEQWSKPGTMMMVVIDPRWLKILWTTPVVDTKGLGGHPAIGSDGTVYIYDPEQNLVGLDPHTGAVVWQPKCEECVPQSYVPSLCKAKALYVSPHPDILINPDDYLYACYQGFFVVFGPAPDRPVISKASSVYEGLLWKPPVIGPDGTFYFLSGKQKKDEYKITVEAVMLGGIKKWSKLIYQSVRQSVQNLYLVAGENAVYVFLANQEGNSQVLALDRERGNILWTREFPEQCRIRAMLCPRPVLSPQGLLYVLLFQEDGEWLVALDTKNEGEQSWSIRVGEAVDYGYGPDYFCLLLTTVNALLVGTNKGVLQIESQTGELSSCVIPGFGRIAMSPDGTVYIVGDSLGSNFGAWDILVKSVPNKPPNIVSLLSSNPQRPWGYRPELIRVEFEATIEDSLDWTTLRKNTGYWDFGDGQTESNSFGTSLDHGQYIGHLGNNVTYDLSNLAKMTFPVQLTVSGGVEGCSVSTTAETIVCLEPPTIQSAKANPGKIYVDTQDVVFSCEAKPPEAQAGQVLEYTWDFGDGESGESMSVSHRYTQPGIYHPTVGVNVEGMLFKARQTMTVEVASFPTLSISTKQKPNRCIEFNCDVEDPFVQEPSSYSWKFGDGSSVFIGGQNPSHGYGLTGIYDAMVTVELPDPKASLIKEFQVCVQDYGLGTLTATAFADTTCGKTPLDVTFTGAGVGPKDVVSYTWDFGDGTTFQGQYPPIHTYSNPPNSYKVTLTVKDVSGNTANDSVNIYVCEEDRVVFEPASGCLKIFADTSEVINGDTIYSGKVLLNGFLGVESITVDSNGNISGTGNLVTGNDDISEINTGGSFTINDPGDSDVGGCYREITCTNSGLSVPFYGFTVNTVGTNPLKLYSNRLSLSGFFDPGWSPLGSINVSCSVSPEEIEFGGGIHLPKITIGGFGFEDAFLELADDPAGWSWRSGVSFGFPNYLCGGFKIGASLGILNGDLNELLIKIKKFPKPPGNLPIGNTGVFLKSLEGGLIHIASTDPDPVVLHAGAGFCAGPEIPIPSISLLDGKLKLLGGNLYLLGGNVDLDLDFGGKVIAEGNAYILSDDFGHIGNAGLTVDINKGLYLRGEVQCPPGDLAILVGEIASKLDLDLEFQASVTGTLQVPDSLPIIGGLHFGQAVGYIDNDLIAVGVSIGDTVCVPILGCADLSLDVCLIFSFDDPGFSVATNWDAIEEVELTSTPQGYYTWGVSDEIPLLSLASQIGAPLRYAGLGAPSLGQPQTLSAAYSNARTNSSTEQGFEIPEGLGVTIFYMQLISEGVPPKFIVTTPEGIEYSEGSNEVIWQRNDTAADLWCAVPNPKPGRWTVTPDPSLSGAEYKIITYRLNEKPTLTITSPKEDIIVEAGTNVTINWSADDPDDTASIRLCYTESPLPQGKSNLPAWPGSTMVKNLSEENQKSTYSWSTKGVAPGKYYIYGVITDGKNFPVFAWSEGSITIRRKDFSPPKGVQAHQEGSTVQVEWDSLPEAVGYRVYYQDIRETTPLVLASSQAVWEDTNTVIGHLQSGVTYRITVTAFQEDGLESDYSNPIEVSL